MMDSIHINCYKQNVESVKLKLMIDQSILQKMIWIIDTITNEQIGSVEAEYV